MANWTVKINTPQNNAGPNTGAGMAMRNRNQPTNRATDESDGDTGDSVGMEENMRKAAMAAELEQAKNADRKTTRSADVSDEMNAPPKSEFVGMQHPEIGEISPPQQQTPEEEAADRSPVEREEPEEQEQGAPAKGPVAADKAGQRQAQSQDFMARMARSFMSQKQASLKKMRPIDQKIKTEQKQVDEVNSAIKKNEAKISSGKTIRRLGCCVMIIPGLGWIVGVIIRILTTKSKIEARKAEAENWAKKGKLAGLKANIAKLKKQRQKLAKQAGAK
jgi:hypothetical protein